MKNTKLAALTLTTLFNLIPASHAMSTDTHGQIQDVSLPCISGIDNGADGCNSGCSNTICDPVPTDASFVQQDTAYELFDPSANAGCNNISCFDANQV